jgi:trehalose 6-phosphate synthase
MVAYEDFEGITLVAMPLTEVGYREFYLGFSTSLWPVHHYRLGLAKLTQESAEGYRRVNDRFAQTLVSQLNKTDLICVHDFHLIPLGAKLRARGVSNARLRTY